MTMKRVIRSRTASDFFGHASSLPINKLPLEREVYNFFRLESDRIRQSGNRNTSQRQIAVEVAKQVRSLWVEKANLPVRSLRSVVRYVLTVVRKAQALTKSGTKRRSTAKEKRPLQALFDICACKCPTKNRCQCPREHKVPGLEWDFLRDQRRKRRKVIGGIDRKTTKAWARKRREDERLQCDKQAVPGCGIPSRRGEPPRSSEPGPPGHPEAGPSSQSEPEAEPDHKFSESDEGWREEEDSATEISNQGSPPGDAWNYITIGRFARECDRYGISDRAAAALGSALLADLGIVTDDDKANVITRDKVRRARDKIREETKNELQAETKGKIQCIGFDGRQDITNIIEEENENREKLKLVGKEKHLVCVAEPGGKYIAHRTLKSENSQSVSQKVLEVIQETGSEQSLVALLFDGTAVNTGWENGAAVRIKRQVDRNLQWLVCLLHANELPLRYLPTFLCYGQFSSVVRD